jgi:methylated-DNA-[protein]-cysteine S-methyltransferase
MINWMLCESPLGPVRLSSDGSALTGLRFAEAEAQLGPGGGGISAVDPVLGFAKAELEAYFAGRLRVFETPLRFRGSEFSLRVWSLLTSLAFGETASYGAMARALGSPGAARAVGAVVGRNPILIMAPCHRVVGAGGALTGYAGGLHRKEALLAMERRGHAFGAHAPPPAEA